MTDLHTHILPSIDDGAENVQQSLVMLNHQAAQGVGTVALTPHYYPRRRSVNSFLEKREEAWRQLQECMAASPEEKMLPTLCLGAEVAYVPGMWEWPELDQLCYEGTKTILIELPFTPWNDEIFQDLYRIMGRRGITPMIAHLDRYLRQQKPMHINRVLEMELPYQVSASAILQPFSQKARELWLRGGVPISDCHDDRHRPPNLGKLRSFISRKYGNAAAEGLVAQTDILNQM